MSKRISIPRVNRWSMCPVILLAASLTLTAQTRRSYTVDIENRYSNVGSVIVVTADGNPFGLPPGVIIAFCSGTLIHERVVLAAGHCTGPGSPAPPPWVKVYVSFSPNARDQSTWRLVESAATHPSMPPCPPPDGCDPTTTNAFRAGDPAVTDLGVLFLAKAAKDVRPAKLAPPGTLELHRIEGIEMASVGYGHPVPPPPGQPLDISLWDGLRKYRLSPLHRVLNHQWATWKLPSAVCFGDSGAPTFLNTHPRLERLDRIVAVASDGGIDCISPDIRVRTDTLAVRFWLKDVIRRHLRVEVDLDGEGEN